MKKFAILINHTKKRIIHGELGPAIKINHVTGILLQEYESLEGCNAELRVFQNTYPNYTIYDTYALWENEVKPEYHAKIAMLKSRGYDIHPSYYD